MIELLVAMALLMLLLASCAAALRAAMQYYRRIDELTAMENSLLVAATLLTRDSAETSRRAVHYQEAENETVGASLTFPLPRDERGALLINHSGASRLMFGSIVSYRVGGEKSELRRFYGSLALPVALAPHPVEHLEPPRDAAFYANITDFKVLAQGVEKFEMQGVQIAAYGSEPTFTDDFSKAQILRLTLRLERRLMQRYGVSMAMDLVPKN